MQVHAPGLTLATPSPTLSTTPAASCPSTQGNSPSGSCPPSVYASVWLRGEGGGIGAELGRCTLFPTCALRADSSERSLG